MRNPLDVQDRLQVATTRIARSTLVLVAACGLALGACERDSASKQALEEASISLASLDNGLGAAPSPAQREKVLNQVTSTLKDASSSSVEAYASSANILIAKAQSGLAETPASQAAALESDALNRVRVIRADLAQWLEANAMALAADAYDPAPEIASLEAQVAEIQNAVAGLTKARTDVSGRRDGLVAEASGLADQSKALRDEIGKLRLGMASVSATDGATIMEQIREKSREADALELKASEITSRADLLVPQIAEIDLNIAGLNNQIESLRAAQAAARQRAADAKTEATEARALAAAAAERIDTGANALIELRDGELSSAYESAQRALSAAAGAARKAASDNRSGSKLAEGVALQQSADLSWQLAQGLGEHHAILSALATASPELPRSGAYDGSAAAAATARTEALTKAAETYEQAKNALTSSGARGEASERLERVGRMLDLIVQATQGQQVDWSAANKPAPAAEEDAPASDDAAEAPASGSDLASTIQGWVDQLNAGDGSFLSSAVYTDVPEIESLVGSVGGLIVKSQRLDALCKDRFGQSLTEFSAEQAGGGGVPGVGGIPDVSTFSASDLDITENGDTATVGMGDGQTMNFRRIDGEWKLDLSQAGLPPEIAAALPMLAQFTAIFPRLEGVVDDLISETESGAYNSTQAVYIAQQQKIMPIVMEAMGSMEAPPGGGG